VNYAAGKNITVKQELETDGAGALTGNQTYTYSLNKDIDLTNAGSLTVGDTKVNNEGITIKAPTPAAGTTPTTTDVKLTNTGLDNGGNKIVNVAEGKADTDAVNVKQLKDAKTILVDGKNTTKSGTGTAADPYKVNVEGDLTGISSITNDGTNNGKISFGPNKTVTVDGDHSITLNASTGKIGGLQNKTFDPTKFTSGQAATEDQLKSVHDTLKASELHIAPTAGTTNNVAEYTVDANNKVTLTYQDGNGTAATAPKAVIDLSALANKITSGYTFNTNAIAKGGAVDGSASVKAVDNGGTINYAAGKNLTVKQEIDTTNKTQTYTYSLNKDINVETVTVTGQNGKDGKIGINGKDGVTRTISVEVPGQTGQPGTPGVDGTTTTRIVFDDKAQANLDDGLKFTGNNESTENKHKLNTLVKVQGEGTKEGTNAAGTKEIQTSDGTKFESAKDNIAVEANNGDTLTVKLNKKLKGLDSVQTKTVELGDHTTPGGTTNITYNSGDKRIEYTTPGATAGTTETKKVATTDDIWTIQGNGTDVAPVNGKVNVKAGENILITTPTTANGTMTINAVTPAVYTDKDGNKLTKDKDGKFHKPDGTEVAPADVITSIQDAAGNVTGGNSIVNNVGSAINNHATPGVTSPTYLDKLDAAAGDTKTQNAAVNVTDLKNTADGLTDKGLKFNANEGGVKTNKLGSTVTVQGSGALTAGKAYADEYNTANIRTNISQNNGDTVINVGLAKALKDINSVSNGSSSITLNSNPGGTNNTPAVQITGGNLSMGDGTTNNKIVNLAPGTANTDAVNVKQLKDTELHITPGTYTPGTDKKVKLTYTDGNGGLVSGKEAVIDLSGLSTGGTTASSWNVKSSANTTDGGAVGATHDATAQNIANGKTVEFQSGKNLVVNQTNDTTNGNATVEFSLDKNLENLDKVVVNGNDGATGQAGVSIVGPKGANGVDGNDGKVGIAGKDGKDAVSISGKDGVGHIGLQGPKGTPGTPGAPGAPGANLDITTDHGTQTLVKPERNNNNQSERIVYVPKDANGNPLKDTDGNDIKREVATMDDGLKFTGNNTSTENKRKLGSLLKVQGEDVSAADEAAFQSAGGNIAVTANGSDTLTIRLNKNLKGLNSIQLGGNTIQSNGDNITFTTNGGNTKTVATTDQLWTIQAGGVDVPAKSGKVNLVAGDHITITPDAANGKMTISATGFGSMDGFNVKTSADANGTHAGDTTENIKNGKTVDMQAGKNLVVTQSNDNHGNTTVNYALNKDVDLGTNGSLTTGATTIDNNGLKNGNTTVGGNGMTIKDPTDPAKTVSLTKDGLNNGGNQITNVASGGNVDTNAANIGDIKRLAKDTRIKDGTYTVDNNGTVELTYVDGAGNQVKDVSGNAITAKITGLTTLDSTRVNVAVNETGSGKAVGSTTPVKVTKGTEFVAGDNLIVERKAHTGNDLDNSVVYSLNSNLTGISSISNTTNGPKMTIGSNDINFTGGDVKISDGNLDMNNNKITNVANGTDPHDAVNVSQLKSAKTIVEAADSSVTVTKDAGAGANGEDIYKIKANPAGTVDLTNVNNRVDQLGEEIGRVGAQGAALSALKPIQYDPLEPTQIMAGYGNYRGNSAVALGVAHYKNESTLIHGGVSWAGGSSHMMANAGVTWKVGNRDSEAAVADRYRKGPISSAYAMQQEMAAMKAQNAGLKGEVSDLKAENEQMKAQIAAMMAKLGL
ncbi:MAG: YadA-like family protein, partial [Veillonella sp.]|nr:YadA-like family protein [Veillonella sp.]